MRFQDPYFLLLLLAVPVMIWHYIKVRRRRVSAIRFSTLSKVVQIKPSAAVKLRHGVFALRVAAVILLVLALARPQSGQRFEEVLTEGIDIMLVLDVSSSMLAEDFKPDNRIAVAKQVIERFIDGRQNDRIGLVIFSGKAFTQCPLTLDYGILTQFVQRADVGMIEDGTAIGIAVATAVHRLEEAGGKSKVAILLTDGVNNAGAVNPQTAAEVAAAMDVKVYTIGAGKRGSAMYPVNDPIFGKRYVRMPTQIDEATLQQIADTTGGQYFRATDAESLQTIYDQIDRMEKTKVEVQIHTKYTDLFWYLLAPGIVLVVLEVVLANTRFRRLS